MPTDDTPPLFPSAPPVVSAPDDRPFDLIPLKEAAKSVDRAPPTLRDWIRAGDLRSWKGEGNHPNNRQTLVSAEELRVLVVSTGKSATPARRPPSEEEELRARLVKAEEDLRAALRSEVEAAQRETAALRLALGSAENRARDLAAMLEREQARADGAEAELRALREVGALPWWRRLLPG